MRRKASAPKTVSEAASPSTSTGSIMDYGAAFNSDVHGIGKYDEAAILFGYAGKVEVFKNLSRNNQYLLKGSAETILKHPWSLGLTSYSCLPSFEDRISPAEDALTEKDSLQAAPADLLRSRPHPQAVTPPPQWTQRSRQASPTSGLPTVS